MNYAYLEEDELNFEQSDGAYDGTEYQLDEFGERIDSGTDDLIEDDIIDETGGTTDMSAEDITTDEAIPSNDTKIENGFGEIINPDNSEHLTDQIDDTRLRDEAESDIDTDIPTDRDINEIPETRT